MSKVSRVADDLEDYRKRVCTHLTRSVENQQGTRLHPCWSGDINAALDALNKEEPSVCVFGPTFRDSHKYGLAVEEPANLCGTPLDALNVNKLYSLGQPASFGDGDKDRIDPDIRDARQIMADQICVIKTVERFLSNAEKCPVSLHDYVNENFDVSEQLHCPVDVRPHKMQLYKEGGHFERHVDTPLGPDHVATLLIVFPTKHTGGALTIDTGAEEPLVFHSDRSDDESIGCPTKLCAVLFPPDAPHSVQRVESGVRVTLQCNVFRTTSDEFYGRAWENAMESEPSANDDDPTDDDNVDTSRREKAMAQLVGALQRWKGEHADGIPSIGLRHRYIQDALKLECLRGIDALMCTALTQAGYRLIPFYMLVEINGHECGNRDETQLFSACAATDLAPLFGEAIKTVSLFMDSRTEYAGVTLAYKEDRERTHLTEAENSWGRYLFSAIAVASPQDLSQ